MPFSPLLSVLVQKLAQDSTISFDLSPADAIRKAEMLTNIIRSEEMNSKSKIKSKITTEEHDLNSAKDNAIASKASQLKDKPRKLSKESDDIIPSEDDDNLDDEFSKDLLDDKKNLCNKLPKKATQILKDWFLNNIHNPYPSPEVKDALTKKTGLSRKQLQNWFTNVRKRYLEPLKKRLIQNDSSGLMTALLNKDGMIEEDLKTKRPEVPNTAGLKIPKQERKDVMPSNFIDPTMMLARLTQEIGARPQRPAPPQPVHAFIAPQIIIPPFFQPPQLYPYSIPRASFSRANPFLGSRSTLP
eukprot:TRINITY_DN2983_c0_g1_i3.p1 TRINITY_DN2983_c0_g1~~TRINITY_DN2983_c0_g1_i3.p1  ORF type:complete len:300 (+),score=47.33 TRINITY_DN2983_c0_g1_i3:313-1212(+)